MPNLSRRNTVYKVPSSVTTLQQQGRPPAKPVIAYIPSKPKEYVPAPPPDTAPKKQGVLRSQPVAKRSVQINYVPDPVPDGQLDRIRRIHNAGRGKALVMVGNGPSITEAPLELLSGNPGIDIMSINKPDPRLWPTQLWAFCDTSQYRRHEDLWRQYNGTIINSTAIYQQKAGSVHVTSRHGFGFNRDLTQGFFIGRSTVYANLQTAMWMGYDHVYLFGVDMNPDGINGQLWFYGQNPDAPAHQRKDRFRLEAQHYTWAADELSREERSKYTFCSAHNPHDFVNKFGRMDHRVAVGHILQQHGGQTSG